MRLRCTYSVIITSYYALGKVREYYSYTMSCVSVAYKLIKRIVIDDSFRKGGEEYDQEYLDL